MNVGAVLRFRSGGGSLRPVRILLLAPHPFYQERGTPLAVNLLLRVLSTAGHTVEVLTYHEGADVAYPGVTLQRIAPPRWVRGVPPGPSLFKALCDVYLFRRAAELTRHARYDVIHAVEEASWIALWLNRRRGLPFIYDMDSAMGRQTREKFPWLWPVGWVFDRLETIASRRALAVIPMCDALAELARQRGARQVFVLRDVSLLGPVDPAEEQRLRGRIAARGVCFLYVGNLEPYQGLDLLLESFALLTVAGHQATLAVAGGSPAHIRRYTRKARDLGIAGQVRFLGPQPVAHLAALLACADVLVSPRIRGTNTPMKIYSYLAAGKAILATDLPTHTQVLNREVAVLAPPRVTAFAAAMGTLVENAALRRQLGERARALADTRYSSGAFAAAVNELYAWVEWAVGTHTGPPPRTGGGQAPCSPA